MELGGLPGAGFVASNLYCTFVVPALSSVHCPLEIPFKLSRWLHWPVAGWRAGGTWFMQVGILPPAHSSSILGLPTVPRRLDCVTALARARAALRAQEPAFPLGESHQGGSGTPMCS